MMGAVGMLVVVENAVLVAAVLVAVDVVAVLRGARCSPPVLALLYRVRM
jgi:hypothetical protein